VQRETGWINSGDVAVSAATETELKHCMSPPETGVTLVMNGRDLCGNRFRAVKTQDRLLWDFGSGEEGAINRSWKVTCGHLTKVGEAG